MFYTAKSPRANAYATRPHYMFFLRLQFTLVLAWAYVSGSGVCYRELLTAFLATKHETTGFYHGPNANHNYRRKFRSQTSDNMDRWKAEMGRGREKRRVEESRSEKRKSQRKQTQMREKVGKSRNTAFFQWFVAPEGRKVGFLKRRVRSQLARWEMKNCTPLWREAHFEVKMHKTHQGRTAFGSCDVEKVHAVVARSTFPSPNVQNTPFSDHFWKLRCRKSARRCGAKHISKSKCAKHTMFGPLLEVQMSKKCTPLWGEAHFEVNMLKTPMVRTTFGRSDVVSRGRRKGFWTLSKVGKTWRFCSISKNDGGRGTFEEDLQRCIFRGRRRTRDMLIRDVRRSGHWFPERGCILEHQIFRFAEMVLRDRCSTSYDLASLFRSRGSTFDRWTGESKRIGTKLLARFVFDAVTFKTWRSLAELLRFGCCPVQIMKKSRRILRFWCCQLRKMRKSRRRASFLMLSTLTKEEVTQNCCVFDVVNFEKWRNLAE